jgi:Flp pilus assembly protein TadD
MQVKKKRRSISSLNSASFAATTRSSGRFSRPLRHRDEQLDELHLSRLLLAAIAIVAPHLFGGVFAWGGVALAASACAVLALTLYSARRSLSDHKLSEPLTIIAGCVLSITILHAIPWPSGWVAAIAPDAAFDATITAQGLDAPAPTWIPFSRDPGATYERIVYAAAVAAAFCAARLQALRGKSSFLIGAVVLSGASIAVSHLLHQAVDAEAVYGLFKPKPGQMSGPLLNPNNFAGYLALCLPISIGFAIKAEHRSERMGWLCVASVMAATGLLAVSRGGTVALVVGPMVMGLLYAFRRRVGSAGAGAERRRSSALLELGSIAGLLLAGTFTLAALASKDLVDNDYQNFSKLAMYREELRYLLGDPRRIWLGVGRGAYSASFSAVQHGSVRAQHAECLPLQYAIEYGVPLAIAFLVPSLVRTSRALLFWRTPIHLGAIAGVVAIGFQNLVDFGLELTGIAVPAAICLAAGITHSERGIPQVDRWWKLRLYPAAAANLALCTAALASYSLKAIDTDISIVRPTLQHLFASGESEQFRDVFPRYIQAHPADAELAGTGGAFAARESEPKAIFWLNRAMTLAPDWEVPHLWAAQWLISRGRWDQGLTEIRVAAEIEPSQSAVVLCNWLPKLGSADKVLSATPDTAAKLRFLDISAGCISSMEAEKVDAVLAREDPEHIGVGLRRARRALSLENWESTRRLAHPLQARRPELAEPYRLEAQALIGEAKYREAALLLQGALKKVDDREQVLGALARAQARAQDQSAMRRTIERLREEAAGDGQKLANALRLLSESEAYLGNHQRALAALREAHRLTADPALLADAARLATQLGQYEYALSAWRELCTREPTSPGQFCRNEEEVQRKLSSR